ncbi:MAG: TlpA family protein disulfide reductase [Ginsengibacter sp.]
MKLLFIFSFLITSFQQSQAQTATSAKPSYVVIMGDKIVTRQDVDTMFKKGYVKGIQKGVTDEQLKGLKKRFGSRLGNDKRFIVVVSLFTEAEKKENDKKNAKATVAADPQEGDTGFRLQVHDTAANFTVRMLDGRKINLADLKGKVVLLNFWATWCTPCMMEFYELPTKIIAPFKGKDFVFLPVSIGEKKVTVIKGMKYLQQKGISFPVGIDPDKSIWDRYGIKGIPKNFLIDKNGVIRYASEGYVEGALDQLAAEIQRLLRE